MGLCVGLLVTGCIVGIRVGFSVTGGRRSVGLTVLLLGLKVGVAVGRSTLLGLGVGELVIRGVGLSVSGRVVGLCVVAPVYRLLMGLHQLTTN